jgi:hypothetical protein
MCLVLAFQLARTSNVVSRCLQIQHSSHVCKSDISINWLPLQSRDLVEKKTVAKLIKKNPAFYQPKATRKENSFHFKRKPHWMIINIITASKLLNPQHRQSSIINTFLKRLYYRIHWKFITSPLDETVNISASWYSAFHKMTIRWENINLQDTAFPIIEIFI